MMEKEKTLQVIVNDFVDLIGKKSIVVGDLHRIWSILGFKGVDVIDIGVEVFEDTFRAGCQEGEERPSLQMKGGGWVVNASSGLVKSSITAGLIAGILSMGGFSQIPVAVLPAVLPLLFDISRVRLTSSEECLHACISVNSSTLGSAKNFQELYQLLPSNVQSQLSIIDFGDFIDKCRRAGRMAFGDDGVELIDEKDARLTITFD